MMSHPVDESGWAHIGRRFDVRCRGDLLRAFKAQPQSVIYSAREPIPVAQRVGADGTAYRRWTLQPDEPFGVLACQDAWARIEWTREGPWRRLSP